MKKIVLAKKGDNILLLDCHIQWLKDHNVVFEGDTDTVYQKYREWVNQNRENPLLIECLELFYDEIERDAEMWKQLVANRLAAQIKATKYVRIVAENIIRRKEKGHLSVDIVAGGIRQGKTFEDLLELFQDNYRHKSHKHPTEEFKLAAQWLSELDRLQYNYDVGLKQGDGRLRNNFIIEEYDDAQYEAKIVLRDVYCDFESYTETETLLLLPKKNGILTSWLEYFVGEDGDLDGLVEYLKNNGVEVEE